MPKTININIFKNVQHSEIIVNNNKEKKINKDIINFKELKISDFTFLTNNYLEFYESRFISNSYEKIDHRFLFQDEIENKELKDIIFEDTKIILLGNPGTGKTIELKNLFNILWTELNKNEIYPFYINIKNFRIGNRLEDLIKFNNWQTLPKIIFIFDGLDEMADIQDFISELEFFIVRNENLSLQYVLSCRTNVYEKYLINITEFKTYFLKNLTDTQIQNILKNKFSINFDFLQIKQNRDYLENPFQLDLFANYYLENGEQIPTSKLQLWDLFVEKSLDQSLQKSKKRKILDSDNLIYCLKKVAILNELMHQNYIEGDNLLELLGEVNKNDVIDLPFIEKGVSTNYYNFLHKNYQEYFAAKFISKLNIEKIIAFIKVNDLNKTKNSLFNTITFLLNIIDGTKYEELEKWLIDNEYEILFHSEVERLNPELRNDIFEKYFEKTCIENTFWISYNRNYPSELLAKFANFNYLITIIKNSDLLFRTIISALEVLSLTHIPIDKKEEFKESLLTLLQSSNLDKLQSIENDKKIKADILRVIKSHNYHTDPDYFDIIIDIFKNEDYKQINHSIITMLFDVDNIDDYFEVFKNEIERIYEIKTRKISDNTIYGTEYYIEKIILKIQNQQNFIQCLNYIFNPEFDLRINSFYDKYEDKLLSRCKYFFIESKEFIFKVIDLFLGFNSVFEKEKILLKIINYCESGNTAFYYIVDKFGIKPETYSILSVISNIESINYIVKKYKENKLLFAENNNFINYFRNNLFSSITGETKKELAFEFEKLMIEVGFEFEYKLLSDIERQENIEKYNNFIQENFDLLFDKNKLLKKIKEVFENNKLESISWDKIHKISREWHSLTNYHGTSNTAIHTIENLIRGNNKDFKDITFSKIEEKLNNDYIYLALIQDKLKRTNEGFKISENQINDIKNLCLSILEKFKDDNYNKVLKLDEDNIGSFRLNHNYYVLKILYFYDMKFDFYFPKEFYLKTLRFTNIMNTNDNNKVFDFAESRINSKDDFQNQITNNINNEALDYFTLQTHLNYAVEHNLKETYDKIGKYILSEKHLYGYKQLLESYIELIDNKLEYLIKCCDDIKSFICWDAIKIIKEKKLDENFILIKANEYLQVEESGYKNFISNAINILFYTNQDNALLTYLSYLKSTNLNEDKLTKNDLYLTDYGNYTRTNELHLIKEYFDLIFDEQNKDTFDFHYAKEFIRGILINLSTNKENYNLVNNCLFEIKKDIKTESKLFHINLLLENSYKSYVNSLSHKLDFNTAKRLINENI